MLCCFVFGKFARINDFRKAISERVREIITVPQFSKVISICGSACQVDERWGVIVPRWGIQVGVALHQTSPSYSQKEPSRPCPQIPCFESFFMTVKFRLVFSWCAWSLDRTVQMPGSDESF